MKKLFLFIAAALVSTGMWAGDKYYLIKEGAINLDDFVTTITTLNSASQKFIEADESETTWAKNLTFGSSRSTAYGQTSNLVEYSVKTTQTKVKIYTKADNASRKVYLQELIEGNTASDPGVTQTFDLGAKNAAEIWSYTSENAKARTLYFFGNNGGIMIYQIEIEECGTPLTQGGQVGYATLLKNGRHAVKGESKDYTIDGITYNVKSDLKPGNGGKGAVMRGATNYMKFSTSGTVVLKVKEANKKGYYLAKTKETYDDTKAIKTGDSEFVLRGTSDWYIICNTSSDTQIDSIGFEAYVPSTDATLASVSVGENALDMSKFTLKEGALQYDYELPMGTENVPAVTYTTTDANANVVKTDAASTSGTTTLTVTAEDGTTTKVYKINFSVKSALGTDATLSDIKVGGVSIEGFDPETPSYNYNIGVYASIPAVTYTLNDPNASDDYKVHNETMVDTIDVTAEDGEHTKRYMVTFVRAAATPLSSISESTTWDWTNVTGSQTSSPVDANTYYNVKDAEDLGISFANTFNASALMIRGARVKNGGSSAQICGMKFHPTVTGRVYVVAANTGSSNKERWIKYGNDTISIEYKGTTPSSTDTVDVPADVDVELLVTTNNLNVSKIGFIQTFAINCAATENGSVSAGKSLAAAGETVTLTVTPATGYAISSVKVNGEDIIPAEEVYSFEMPAAAANVVATFSAIAYEIAIDDAIENGSVTAKVGGVVAATATIGQTVTLDVEPTSANYSISSVTMNGEAVTKTAGVYSFEMPAQNVTVSATFAEKDAAPIYWKLNEVVVDAAEVTYGSTPYALPALTNTESLTVALASSATDVAEFDGSTLNIKKAGTANISATYTATADGDYKTTVVSYALTVKSGSGTSLDNTADEIKAVKFFEKGQLYIRRGEKVYTITGELVK